MARDSKKDNDLDALMMEYNLALDEHKTVNAQILHFQEANTKLYEFGLIALGAVVVAASFAIEHTAYNLLLVLSLPFHILMWLQIRRGIVSNHLANYIIHEIAPRVRNTVNEYYDSRKTTTFIFWEEYVTKISRKNKLVTFVVGLSEAGRIIYQISISAALVIAYFLYTSMNNQYGYSGLDIFLLVLNGVAFTLSIFGIIIASGFYGDPDKKEKGKS